jgi:hypothetical protein
MTCSRSQNFERKISRLKALERVRAKILDQLCKIIHDLWNLVVFVDGYLVLRHTFLLQSQPRQGLTDLLHTDFRQFASLDKMALVVITMFAPEQENTVHPL